MEKIIGINAVNEAIESNINIEYIEIFVGVRPEQVVKLKTKAKKKNIIVKDGKKKIENSQGVVAYISDYNYYITFKEFLESAVKEEKSTILILDGVQDPRNFGALIRSAEIFGIKGIIIPERNSVKINETVVKTSTGAIEYVNIIKVKNIAETIDQLKRYDFWIYGAEGNTEKYYYEEKYPNKVALVLGSEGFGIRKKVREHCDILIKIPMKGKINSLNVSVAGGILLSEISKNR
ncbi:MAG TPA: 23S rRNA (guanosine(2251)-2'-O)-methyltransferase RlmB [Fusobacteriaceae bacterium]|jgi:23S rRNA (guanosine2251-2'-O)-methyltransferase|nr:23S rRNA (guanosine(2251)-2'-O)-methyltransferase RlmB [Fusobacteriaceae bacterium]